MDGSIGEDHTPETHLIPICLQAALGQRDAVTILGRADPSYPLQKKRHSFEFLREIAHLRVRTPVAVNEVHYQMLDDQFVITFDGRPIYVEGADITIEDSSTSARR